MILVSFTNFLDSLRLLNRISVDQESRGTGAHGCCGYTCDVVCADSEADLTVLNLAAVVEA